MLKSSTLPECQPRTRLFAEPAEIKMEKNEKVGGRSFASAL